MATCNLSTLIQSACDNGFVAAANDADTYRALKLQLACNISAGSSSSCAALSGDAPPTGSVTPQFIGQLYNQNDGEAFFYSTGLTSADWTKIESEAYVRPADWLTIPAIGATDQMFIGLLAVTDDAYNYVALSAAANYHVDWGDGNEQDVASGVTAQHLYNFADLSPDTITDRGYRQALVTVSPQAGQNITSINLQKKHSAVGTGGYMTKWLDFSLSSPHLSSMTITGASITTPLQWLENATLNVIGSVTTFSSLFISCISLQSVTITGSGAVTVFTSMFSGCRSLSTVPLFDTGSGTNFSTMFNNCTALRAAPLFDTGSGTSFVNMFNSCSALRMVPLFDLGSGTNFNSMFGNCSSLQAVPLFDTGAGTNFTSVFSGCTALQAAPLFDTAAGTTFMNMFSGCTSLITVPALNTSAGTDFTTMFNGCSSLVAAPLAGTTRSVSYINTQLPTPAIVDIFNALGTAAGAQTINVTSTPGYAALTAGDKLIATAKGWTVT